MALCVEIYERENVRPISPTPESSRHHKLCVLDQLIGTFYMPLVFFYESQPHDDNDYVVKLKDSLSKTLSVLYPLAGRLRDGITVECNDEGAEFVVANVTNYDLGEILKHPRQDLLLQLFPRDPYPTTFDAAQPMLGVQMNRFRCGGTALAVCLWHALTDGAGLSGFLRTWSAFNRGEKPTTNHESFIADATSFFTPLNFNISKKLITSSDNARRNYYAKRFVFSSQEIERLRNEYSQPGQGRRWSRVETLSAFIWAAVIRATLKANPNLKTHMLTNVVDLRKKVNPNFPSTCLGNINQVTVAWWEADDDGVGLQAESLIGRVRESIRRVNDDYVKKMHANGGYLKAIQAFGKRSSNSNDFGSLGISSWLTLQCLKVDFGWGKPVWVGSGNAISNLALLLDSIDGGVEVWIGLRLEIMCNLENDKEFLAPVSFSQILWDPSHLSARL